MMTPVGNIEEFMTGIGSREVFISNKLVCHAVVYNLQ